MIVPRQTIQDANKITAKYNGYQLPSTVRQMYHELAAIGITTGIIGGGHRSCEWYFDGEEVENSVFVYDFYEPNEGLRNDYTIYFS